MNQYICSAGTMAGPTAVGTATLNIGNTQAASAANGRDQAAHFSAGSQVYIYVVDNGAGSQGFLASLSSGAPTVPAGWVLNGQIGSLFLDPGNGDLFMGQVINTIGGVWSDIFYSSVAATLALNGGTIVNAVANTAVTLAAYVPADAVSYTVQLLGSNGGTPNISNISPISGNNYAATWSPVNGYGIVTVELPYIDGNIYYSNAVSGGTSYINILGYKIIPV